MSSFSVTSPAKGSVVNGKTVITGTADPEESIDISVSCKWSPGPNLDYNDKFPYHAYADKSGIWKTPEINFYKEGHNAEWDIEVSQPYSKKFPKLKRNLKLTTPATSNPISNFFKVNAPLDGTTYPMRFPVLLAGKAFPMTTVNIDIHFAGSYVDSKGKFLYPVSLTDRMNNYKIETVKSNAAGDWSYLIPKESYITTNKFAWATQLQITVTSGKSSNIISAGSRLNVYFKQ